MEFSNRLQNIVASPYRLSDDCNEGISIPSAYVNIPDNNSANAFLKIDISDFNNLEIPSFGKSIIETVIVQNLSVESGREKEILIPLFVNGYSVNRSTADSILKEFFRVTSYSERLKKNVSNKGEVVYGGNGILLDKNLNPLLIYTALCRTSTDEDRLTIHHFNNNIPLTYTKLRCRVNPRVFIEDTVINKAIIKKIIPILANQNIWFYSDHFNRIHNELPTEVIIDNFDNFIVKPNKPDIEYCNDEILNTVLVNNIEDILSGL